MKLFSLLFDSPIYAEICNYLEIKDIKNIYIYLIKKYMKILIIKNIRMII